MYLILLLWLWHGPTFPFICQFQLQATSSFLAFQITSISKECHSLSLSLFPSWGYQIGGNSACSLSSILRFASSNVSMFSNNELSWKDSFCYACERFTNLQCSLIMPWGSCLLKTLVRSLISLRLFASFVA